MFHICSTMGMAGTALTRVACVCRFKQGSPALLAFSQDRAGGESAASVTVLQSTTSAVLVEVDVETSETLVARSRSLQRSQRGAMRLDCRPIDNATSRRQLDAVEALAQVEDGGNPYEVRLAAVVQRNMGETVVYVRGPQWRVLLAVAPGDFSTPHVRPSHDEAVRC